MITEIHVKVNKWQ